MLNFFRKRWKIICGELTFAELFLSYKKEKFPEIAKSTQNGYLMAYKHAARLHDMIFTEIKLSDLSAVIRDVKNKGKGYSTQKKVKVLFMQLYYFAIVNERTEKDYSRYVKIGRNVPTLPRIPFSEEEIKNLFEHVTEDETIETILIMIYSGIRVGELRNLKKADIHLSERYFIVTESKTEAGRNRIVPINKKIVPYIEKRMHNVGEYLLLNCFKTKISYTSYAKKFKKTCKHLGMDHYPHDCRHTAATLLSNAEANPVSIKRILGHASKDVTEKVYTHKDLRELMKAIDLI